MTSFVFTFRMWLSTVPGASVILSKGLLIVQELREQDHGFALCLGHGGG